MDDRKQPPVALLMLPLVALGAMLAFQYFAPPKAQTEEPVAEQAAQPTDEKAPDDSTDAASEASGAEISATDARSRTESQELYKLENDRFIASFTNLNT